MSIFCIIFEILKENWQKPPLNAPVHPPSEGILNMLFIVLYNSAKFKNYDDFFNLSFLSLRAIKWRILHELGIKKFPDFPQTSLLYLFQSITLTCGIPR